VTGSLRTETHISGNRVYRELASFKHSTAFGVVMPITAKYELRHLHPCVIHIEVKKSTARQARSFSMKLLTKEQELPETHANYRHSLRRTGCSSSG
jgi:hypothetical protein